MYFWKCWRDTRGHFLVALSFVVLGVVVAVFSGALHYSNEDGWSMLPADMPGRVQWIWRHALHSLGAGGILVIPMVGLTLGGTGVGDEFRQGSLEFLLTRPRRRRFFVWAGWATGAAELLALCLLAVPVALALLLYLTGSLYSGRIFAFVPLLFTSAVVMYGLAYFLTVLTRSGHYGQSLSLGVVFAYLFLCWTLHTWWRIDLPGWWELFYWAAGTGVGDEFRHQRQLADSFPTVQLVGWGLLAVAFPLGAQLLFERAEV